MQWSQGKPLSIFEVEDNFKRNIRSFCGKQKILIWDDIPAIREMGQLEEIINTLFGIVYPLKRAYKNTL